MNEMPRTLLGLESLERKKAVNLYTGRLRSQINSIEDVLGVERILERDGCWIKRHRNRFLLKVWHKSYARIRKICQFLVDEAIETQVLLNQEGPESYRYKARFKINSENISTIKGYDLFLKLGRYHPTDNPNGVVKDHMVSVDFGRRNNIPPEVIGNLMNCEFLSFRDNLKKSNDCSMTIEKLLKRIGSH